ncbi:MAG: helix-turn-helix transcriptional regulator [Bacteroidales bacterium]|nr:helix-turn-helix transcriptional regulator [Bacteroidales bacterium]MBR6334133.1 helix-turn-helix transcriptional regulator [Bacteroidales bacterium]
MEQIVMIIEKSRDYYGAYAENGDGIYAAGETIEEVQADTLRAIELIKSELPEAQWPKVLKSDYEIIWKFDAESFLSYYSTILTLTGLQRITGINSKQLSHYATGHRKPSPKTVSRIQEGLNRFSEMLSHIQLM